MTKLRKMASPSRPHKASLPGTEFHAAFNLFADRSLELQIATPATNPVARWVESVQVWMPGSGGDSQDSQEQTDWTARAKGMAPISKFGYFDILTQIALEFLSQTLEYVGNDVLKASQGT